MLLRAPAPAASSLGGPPPRWRALEKCGPTLANFGQLPPISPHLGRLQGNFGEARADVGHQRTGFGRVWAHFGRARSELAQASPPKSAQSWPTSTQMRPIRAKFGWPRSKLAQTKPISAGCGKCWYRRKLAGPTEFGREFGRCWSHFTPQRAHFGLCRPVSGRFRPNLRASSSPTLPWNVPNLVNSDTMWSNSERRSDTHTERCLTRTA